MIVLHTIFNYNNQILIETLAPRTPEEILSNLKEKLELNLSFKSRNDFSYGIYNYYSTIVNRSREGDNEISIVYSVALPEAKGQLYDKLDKMKSVSILFDYVMREDSLILVFNLANEHKADAVETIKDISNMLKDMECRSSCLSCKESKESKLFAINESVSCLCSDCSRIIEDKINTEKNKSDRYIPGAIGALLGGLVGSIVWFIIGQLNFYASIAGYVVANAAFRGYNLFKGRQSKIGALITAVAILLSILFAEYAGIMNEFMTEYPELGFQGFIQLTPQLFSDSGFLSAILPNLGLGLVFAGLGSHKLIRGMFTNTRERKELLFESL